ncbi:hypothetical protein GGS24DRAFT_503766 [Hypoxylon argillaceum]|nr:hypothetical protein GGS24DRAFT_503766 [Hypoxylon argillaceum]
MTNSHHICNVAGDLELVVRERDYDQGATHDGRRPLKETATIRVSRACVQRATSLLDTKAANHGEQDGVHLVIDDESITAVKVWMDVLHRNVPQDENISIEDVWWAIHFGNKYLLNRKEGAELSHENDEDEDEDALKPAKDMSCLAGWFTRFYTKHEKYFKMTKANDTPRAFLVLAPAYWFDCPQIFHDITNHIAYNTACSIENRNPTRKTDRYMRGVPNRMLSQLSAARGSQRTRLDKWLPHVLAPCEDHAGECLDVMIFSHKKSLLLTGIQSLFSLIDHKRTLNELLNHLDKYQFVLAPVKPRYSGQEINPWWSKDLCRRCTGHRLVDQAEYLTSNVLSASKRVRRNFGGLCLDCMHKFKTYGDHSDYFMHDRHGHYDRGCRVKHGQPTWYFSYMGRKELMLRHQGQRAEERREKNKGRQVRGRALQKDV